MNKRYIKIFVMFVLAFMIMFPIDVDAAIKADGSIMADEIAEYFQSMLNCNGKNGKSAKQSCLDSIWNTLLDDYNQGLKKCDNSSNVDNCKVQKKISYNYENLEKLKNAILSVGTSNACANGSNNYIKKLDKCDADYPDDMSGLKKCIKSARSSFESFMYGNCRKGEDDDDCADAWEVFACESQFTKKYNDLNKKVNAANDDGDDSDAEDWGDRWGDDDTTNNNPGNSMIGDGNYNPTLPGGNGGGNGGTYKPTFSYENEDLFVDGASPCSNSKIAMAVSVIGKVISIIQVVVPILLVIMAIVDLLKAVVSQDDNNTSKTMKKLVKRVISAVIIFFIIAIVRLVCNIAGKDVDASCMNILGDPWSYEAPEEED